MLESIVLVTLQLVAVVVAFVVLFRLLRRTRKRPPPTELHHFVSSTITSDR